MVAVCSLEDRRSGGDGNGQGGMFKEGFRGRLILQILELRGMSMFEDTMLQGQWKWIHILLGLIYVRH